MIATSAATRRRAGGIVGTLVLALVLAGCTSGGGGAGGWAGSSSANTAAVAIEPAGTAPVNPTSPVVVRATRGTLGTVTLSNAATGRQVSGRLSADRTSWTSTEPLGYAATYRVSADAAMNGGAPVHQTATVTTLSPQAQAFPSFIPPPSATDVGVGQPLVVKFDQDVTDKAAAERALQVTSSPPQTGGWYWLSKREVHYRPQNYWAAGTTITVKANVYGIDLGNGVYGQTDRTETIHVHDSWIAKADGKTEQMQVFHNGQLVNTLPISLGSPGFPTHEGPHVISDKQPSIVMDSCTYGVCAGQPGYYRETVNLDERISNDGEFVHSAPWSVGQQGNSNVSHGCVNLAPNNAQWFFDNFGIGDVVEITNSGGARLQMGDNYGDWELPWPQWQAGSALHG